MFEQMKWENVYELWRMCGYQFSKVLTEPVSAETVFVEYRKRLFLVVVGLLTVDRQRYLSCSLGINPLIVA